MGETQRELLKRLGVMLVVIAIYLLGQQIPLVGSNAATTATLDSQSFWQVLGLSTGARMTVPVLFSLGLGPYMSAMIVWQVIMTFDFDSVRRLSQRQVGTINKFMAFGFAVFQASRMVTAMHNKMGHAPAGTIPGGTIILLVGGALLALFLAEYNQAHGLGGPMVLIIPGVISNLPQLARRGLDGSQIRFTRELIVAAVVWGLVVIGIGVASNRATINLPLIRAMMPDETTKATLPMPWLTAGVLPLMFTSSLFALFRQVTQWAPIAFLNDWVSLTRLPGLVLYAMTLVGLCFAFAYMTLMPGRTARLMQESGDYLPGVLPGNDTAAVLKHHLRLLTTSSAFLFILLAWAPLMLAQWWAPAAALAQVSTGSFILATIMTSVTAQIRALAIKNHYQLLPF